MHALGWLGVVFLVLWAVLWLGLHIVTGAVHLLVVVGVVLLIVGIMKRGARAVGGRV